MSRFSKYAWSVLLYNIAVIIWGAYVRASLSGAGCGSHWPLCNGQMIPQAETIKTWVEFAHRATSGLSFISVLVLLVWAFRKFQKGSALRKATSWAMGFILSEALIGAVLVLYGWVAENRSKARVVSIALHLINTLFLIASLTLTARWSEEKYPSKLWSESKPRLDLSRGDGRDDGLRRHVVSVFESQPRARRGRGGGQPFFAETSDFASDFRDRARGGGLSSLLPPQRSAQTG